jgi:hypothetical protein
MAYTKQDLVDKLKASKVGGNYIAGERANAVFVGKINEEGVFFITPEGEAMLKALEEAPVEAPKPTKATKAKVKASMVSEEDDIAAAIAQAE